MPPHFLNQAPNSNRSERFLLGMVDLGLIMALFVVPMMLGGNHALGRLTLIIAAALAATAWAARQAIHRERFFPANWAMVILGVGLLIPVVQLVPLPEVVRNVLSPHLAKILPLWQSGADATTRLGSWRCLSLTPAATQAGLVIFAAYSLLFIVVVGRVQTTNDLKRLLRWCGAAVLLVAIFAIVQYFFGNGKFFWFYEHPYKNASNSLKGPFANRNHFAQFMALGIGPILIWIVSHYSTRNNKSSDRALARHAKNTSSSVQPRNGQQRTSSQRNASATNRFRFDNETLGSSTSTTSMKAGQFLLAMMAGLVVFACLLSLSRGGSTAMLIAILVCCGISFSVKGASRQMLTAVTMAGIILGSSLMIFGYEKVCKRLGNLTSGKVELMDNDVGRRAIWETDLQATSYFPILGTGIGSHKEVYPIFFDHTHYDYREFTHAENGYIQTLLESGGTGALVLLAAIGMVGFWCINGLRRSRSDELRLCLAAISATIAASLFHSMTDFIWYIPGCATMTVIIAACAMCAHRLALQEAAEAQEPASNLSPQNRPTSFSKKRVQPSTAWAIAGAMVIVSIVMIQERLGPAQAQPYLDDSIRAEVASKYYTMILDDLPREELREAAQFFMAQIERLRQVVRYEPGNARAHRSLAFYCLNLFDLHQIVGTNSFSTRHIGDAVLQSEFKSPEAVDAWLHRAFGKNVSLLKVAHYHARCSVKACPTLGRSYLYLTELSFLDNFSFDQKIQLLDQVLLVRPRCGSSVLELADTAVLSGNFEQWAKLARRVYRMNLDTRKLVLSNLLDNTQTDMLPIMIAIINQQFEPDHEAALYMLARCKKRIPEVQLADLRRYCATQAISGLEQCTPGEVASRRLVAALQYKKLGEPETALAQLRVAHECDPNSLSVRQNLALSLIEQGSPKEAQNHLRWCLRRKPGNKRLEKWFRDALAADLDAQARSEDNGDITR